MHEQSVFHRLYRRTFGSLWLLPSDRTHDYAANWAKRARQLKVLKGPFTRSNNKFSFPGGEFNRQIFTANERATVLIVTELPASKIVRFQWGRAENNFAFESFVLTLDTARWPVVKVSDNLSSVIVVQGNGCFLVTDLLCNRNRRVSRIDNLLQFKINSQCTSLTGIISLQHNSPTASLAQIFESFRFIGDKVGIVVCGNLFLILNFETDSIDLKAISEKLMGIFTLNSCFFIVYSGAIEAYCSNDLALLATYRREIESCELIDSYLVINHSCLLELPVFVEHEMNEEIICISSFEESIFAVLTTSYTVNIYFLKDSLELLHSFKVNRRVERMLLHKYYLYLIEDTNLQIVDFVTGREIRKINLFIPSTQIEAFFLVGNNPFLVHSLSIDSIVFSSKTFKKPGKTFQRADKLSKWEDEEEDPEAFANHQLREWLSERDDQQRLQARLELFMHDESISDEEVLVEYIKMISMEEL